MTNDMRPPHGLKLPLAAIAGNSPALRGYYKIIDKDHGEPFGCQWFPEAKAEAIIVAINSHAGLVALCAKALAAMEKSVDVGSTDHLDCSPDGGKFWYDALDALRAAGEMP